MKKEKCINPIPVENQSDDTNGCKVIAIGGGKGGIGKTVIAASMAVGIALMKHRVAVIDADLGCPNLHMVFGIRKHNRTVQDLLDGKVKNLSAVLTEVPGILDLRVGCALPGTFGEANLGHERKIKFIRNIQRLDVDYVVLDLGAGTHNNTLDCFLSADLMLVLVTPDSLSILDAFGFVKQALFRRLALALHAHPEAKTLVLKRARQEFFSDSSVGALIETIRSAQPEALGVCLRILKEFQPSLLVNKMRQADDETECLAVQVAVRELLSIQMDYLGHVHFDAAVPESIKHTLPFLKDNPGALASQDLARIVVSRILARKKIQAAFDLKAVQKRLRQKWDMRKTLTICDVTCLYWEECAYKNGGHPCKLQHLVYAGRTGQG